MHPGTDVRGNPNGLYYQVSEWRSGAGRSGRSLAPARGRGTFDSSITFELNVSALALAPSRRLAPPLDFALVAGIVALALFASATPSPLYADYAADWHFSTPVLTAVYAVYAIGVLTTLLLIGRLSDEVGRRPVLIVALVALLLATVLYMAAQSVAWLFAARGLQGLATGAALAAAGAAMLDLHPRGDAVRAGLVNGVGSALGHRGRRGGLVGARAGGARSARHPVRAGVRAVRRRAGRHARVARVRPARGAAEPAAPVAPGAALDPPRPSSWPASG